MIRQKLKAFTLVELIVVITIVAILGTIAFISLQGYSRDSRDSVRISDVSKIKTALELFHIDAGKYPYPDEYETVQYETEDLWYQGVFGTTNATNVSRTMKSAPRDPLTDKLYVYSILNNKNRFEILSLMEGETIAGNMLENTYAGNLAVNPRIDGNYEGVFIKSASYIVPSPSIITAEPIDASGVMELNKETFKSMVVTSYDNVPDIGGNIKSQTGALDGLNLTVYTGSITAESSDSEKVAMIQAVQETYSGSQLENNGIIGHISSATGTGELLNVVDTVVLGDATELRELSCDANTKPVNSNITFTVGNPATSGVAWQNISSGNPCYFVCNQGFTYDSGSKTCVGADYTVSGSFGASGAGASISVCGQTPTANGSGNFSITVTYATDCSGVSATKTGYTCNTTTDGPASLSGNISNIAGNCTANTYTVTGSFGVSANGATINGCSTSTTADASGNFSFPSVSYGTNCNNITATRSTYTCTTTTNGPASLSGNVSNIAGSCSLSTYTVSGSFGGDASGASVDVCGNTVTADGSGDFTTTAQHGTDCSSVTVTKSGYTCVTTTDGPASLAGTTTNIAGNCTYINCGTGSIVSPSYSGVNYSYGEILTGNSTAGYEEVRRFLGEQHYNATLSCSNGTVTVSGESYSNHCDYTADVPEVQYQIKETTNITLYCGIINDWQAASASEGGSFTVGTPSRWVRYGVNPRYYYKYITDNNSHYCGNSFFGDPWVLNPNKKCYKRSKTGTSTN